MHSFIPSISGVGIEIPSISLIGGGPIWDCETLVDGFWVSVEFDISDSLKIGVWMEVLGVDVM